MLLGFLGDILMGWFQKIVEFIAGFFAFIPMTVYFIFTSCCSLLDMFQYLIRKLAGLDVYYVDGIAVEGDMLVSFIRGILGIDGGAEYSTLSTVFWSLIIFSVILLVLTTIISIIKAHYNYDAKKSQPMAIITNSIKALFTMVVVPIVTIFGLYLSEIVLKYLDMLTSAGSGTNIASVYGSQIDHFENFGQMQTDEKGAVITDENGDPIPAGAPIYASYDAFGQGGATSTITFSGAVFKVAAYDCNRVRLGSYSTKSASNGAWTDFGVFFDPNGGDRGAVANRIDEAFANRLTLKNDYVQGVGIGGSDSWIHISAYLVGGGQAWWLMGCLSVKSFSKYNVGLVWYYYNLWTYNYFLGFAAIAAMFTLMINIIFGLITRLITCLALFLVYSPTIGITPLDGGNAYKRWKDEFIQQILMAYGAILGMNIFFLILPFFYSISFFNNLILDRIMSILFIIAGLSLIKKFIKLVSGFVGGKDANAEGKDVAEDVKKTGMKAAGMTMGAAKIGVGVGAMGKGISNAIYGSAKKRFDKGGKANKVFGAIGVALSGGHIRRGVEKGLGKRRDNKIRNALGLKEDAVVTNDHMKQFAQMKNLKKLGNVDKKEIDAAFKSGNKSQINAVIAKNNEVANDRIEKNGGRRDEKATKEGRIIQSASTDGAKQGLKAFGKGLLDLHGAHLKLAGDMTGITKFTKDLAESGALDKAKETLLAFGQKIGKINLDNVPKGLQTKKMKEDGQKRDDEALKTAQRITSENSEKVKTAVEKLVKTFERMNTKK